MVANHQNQRTINILLVGDRKVGKTTIILSLVSEEFPENVPARSDDITIPADVTHENIPSNIVDFSAEEQSEQDLIDLIKQANVICIVYAVNNRESVQRISSYWMPLIRQNSSEIPHPVVLVGNKIDLVEYSTIDNIYEIMERFTEIETCIECSAKTLKNITEVFYYAQKAVLHPTAPIYSLENADLSEACKKALIRIFKICDTDCDGFLNDVELNHFQSRCFNAPLQPNALEDVKMVLKKNLEESSDRGVSLKGFLFLHNLFIQRGKNETTWTVLRKFGYNDNLNMSKEYLYPSIEVPAGCTTELSARGRQFITNLFNKYDKDIDRALSPNEYQDLFSTCPTPAWDYDLISCMVETNKEGWITYQGFMSQWALMTSINLPKTFELLAYLGYNIYDNGNQLSAINVVGKKEQRSVYQCHVIGASGAGKTTFCKSFINKRHKLGEPSSYTANTVQVYGQEKTMILKEINVRSQSSESLAPHQVLCDVACLVYDLNNPKSFEYVARVYIKHFAEEQIPVLIVACKDDLEEVTQNYLVQPTGFCQKYKMPPPQRFSLKTQPRKDLFVKLTTMAAFPNLITSGSIGWWKTGLSLAAVAALGLIVAKVLNSNQKIR